MKVNEKFDKKVHKILKTYDSVLVKCKNIPIQFDKNVVIVSSMEGMVNAQIETRKPILYFKEDESMSFMLVDGTEIYVYIIKKYPEKACSVENVINNFNNIRNTFVKEVISKFQNILLNGNSGSDNSENNNLKNDNLLSFNDIKFLENMKIGNLTDNNKEQKFNNNIKNVNFQENNINLQNNEQNNTNFSNIKDEIEKNSLNNNVKNNNEVNNNDVQTNIENNNQNVNFSNEVSLALIKKRKKFNLFGLRNKSKKNAQRRCEKNKKAI